jgi:transposase-like protein
MAAGYQRYSPEWKQSVLEECEPGTLHAGFAALARRHHISDRSLVQKWYKRWDGTKESLEKKTRPNRERKLTEEESAEHVLGVVEQCNREGRVAHYDAVQKKVKHATGKDVSLRTLRRYGKRDHRITEKQTTRKLAREGTNPSSRFLFLAHVFVCCVLGIWFCREG